MKLEYCYSGMKVCDMEIEIATFVVNGSVKLRDPSRGTTGLNPGKKQNCCYLSYL